MSETGGDRPDLVNVEWAAVDQSEIADPGSGLHDAGWPDLAIPANEHHNWLLHHLWKNHEYLQAVVPREYTAIGEGPENGAAGELFRILGFGTGSALKSLGDSAGTLYSPGAGVLDVVTDIRRLFVAQSTNVLGRDWTSDPPVADWSVSPNSLQVNHLAADGLYVYAATNINAAAGNELFLLNVATGATVAGINVSDTLLITSITANGVELAAAYGQYVQVWDTLGASPASVGVIDHGDSVIAVAMDHANVYLCGATGTGGYHVRARRLSDLAVVWDYALEGVPTPTNIATDGELVYVSTQDQAILDEGEHNLQVLNAHTGELVYRRFIGDGSTTSLEGLAVDDRFLWASDNQGRGHAVDKLTGEIVWAAAAIGEITDVNGLIAIAIGDTVVGVERGGATRAFMLAAGDDPARTPYHKLAIPLVTDRAGLEPRPLFGTEFSFERSTTQVTNTTQTPVIFLTHNFNVRGGEYRIAYYYVWGISNTVGSFIGAANMDASPIAVAPHTQESTNSANNHYLMFERVITLTPGAHSFVITLRRGTAAATVRIEEGGVMLWRVG